MQRRALCGGLVGAVGLGRSLATSRPNLRVRRSVISRWYQIIPRRFCKSKTAGPFLTRLFEFIVSLGSIIHAAHAARWHRRSLFLFRNLRDQCFGGEQQARDGRGVLQRGARDLGRIDDTRLHQVGVFVVGDVVTFVAFALLHFLNDELAYAARVVSKLTRRLFDGTANNRHADFFIAFEVLDVVERFLRAQQRDTAAWDDAFLNRRTRGVQRVFDPSFLLFHLGLSRSADVDDCDTACEFRQALLQFLAIVIAGRLFNLTTDLSDAALNIGLFAFAFDNGGVLLVDSNTLGLAEVLELDVLKLDAEIFGDATPTGEHRDIFQHRLATVAEARCFNRADLQRA